MTRPLKDSADALKKLSWYNKRVSHLEPPATLDSFIYNQDGSLHLGVTKFGLEWNTAERAEETTSVDEPTNVDEPTSINERELFRREG